MREPDDLIVGQTDEIFGVTPINWEDSSWQHLSLIGDDQLFRYVKHLFHREIVPCLLMERKFSE